MKNQKIVSKDWKKNGSLFLEEYLENGGFKTLEGLLTGEITARDILDELEESGLRGRGGSGFLLGTKWKMAYESVQKLNIPFGSSEPKSYFICNADESEPGAYKDRTILEKNPFPVIESIIIGSRIINASKAFIYLNGGYRETAENLKSTIKILERNGWLGDGIKGSDFSLEIEIFEGAGSYVCGEETALLNSIEGKRGEPRFRPPYPVEKGLFDKPTIINNVETLANVPFILNAGASKFKSSGKSKWSFGQKLFLLDGPVKSPGILEAPLGVSVEELISKYAGGLLKNKKIKFAQIGGSGGRVILPKDFEKPLGFDSKKEIPVGSGAVLLVEDNFDLKKIIFAWASFFHRESCGKCVPCREGTYQLLVLARKLQKKKLNQNEKEKLEDIIFAMKKASFCAFGNFAVNGWEGIIKNFPDEIIE